MAPLQILVFLLMKEKMRFERKFEDGTMKTEQQAQSIDDLLNRKGVSCHPF
jgi:hypothetical protein